MADNRNYRVDTHDNLTSEEGLTSIGFRITKDPLWEAYELPTPDGNRYDGTNRMWEHYMEFKLYDSYEDIRHAVQDQVIKDITFTLKDFPIIGFRIQSYIAQVEERYIGAIDDYIKYPMLAVKGSIIIDGTDMGFNNISDIYFNPEISDIGGSTNFGFYLDEGIANFRFTFAWYHMYDSYYGEDIQYLTLGYVKGDTEGSFVINRGLRYGNTLEESEAYYNYLMGSPGGSDYNPPDDNPDGGEGEHDDSTDDTDFPDDDLLDGIDDLVANNGFFTLYQVNKAQLQLLSDYLWDDNVFSTFSKMWNSPMECFISARLFPFSVGGTSSHMTFAGKDSNISALKVTNHFKTIDLGSVEIRENFGSFLDYTQTEIQIYLPFIGYRSLDIQQCMNSVISIQYKIDLMTGAFACYIKSSNAHGLIAVFDGTMGYEIPISQSNNSGIVQALSGLSIASVGTFAGSGLAVAGGLMGVGSGQKKDVSFSGSFSANAGFLGSMQPYIIIKRPITNIPPNYMELKGASASRILELNQISGLAFISDIHFEHVKATQEELTEIENLLGNGVIF